MAVFSLAGLLRLRRLREDQAAAEVGHARSRASEIASQRHQLIDSLSDHGHEARDVRGIAAISAARASTSTMLADLEALHIAQAQIVADAEARHRDARRGTLSVEKLEERHDEATRVEDLRAEQAVLDELAGRARRFTDDGSSS
ncbi:MAG TPA: flagellar export protein FliJ [Amnibacterium sp.]|jgi:flagellar FliJ protein|uniref:flagellar FliJ family protein n=1 Tax=Amnibacterium sp. TaxID=1872496 RepID=UPI002F946C07